MELIDFLKNIQSDVQTEISTRTEESDQQGLYAEVIFTEIVTQHMSEIGRHSSLRCVVIMQIYKVYSV